MIFNCHNSKSKKAVDDLAAAINSEYTSSEKYAKFAQTAVAEGFDTLARLFEATSKSESIHAINHSKILAEFTGNPGTVLIGSYEIKTTAENLQNAINGETFDMQKMYPGFIRDAEKELAAPAAKTFTLALLSEIKHLDYYRQASTALANGNENGLSFDWYICPVCGNIYNPTDLKDICDLCLTKKDQFIGYTEIDDPK
jgi:rubrerythrin